MAGRVAQADELFGSPAAWAPGARLRAGPLLEAALSWPPLSLAWRLALGPIVALAVLAVETAVPELAAAPFVLCFVAVVVAAWFGGYVSGSIAVVLTTAVGYYVFRSSDMPRSAAWVAGLYVVASATTAALCTSFRNIALSLKRKREDDRRDAEHLALVLNAGRAGRFEWEPSTDAAEWSRELLDLYGLGREHRGGGYEEWLTSILPEDRPQSRAAITRALETGDFAHEFRICRRGDGAIRWMHARGRVLFDEHGRPQRLVGINVDVTDRKRTEQELRLSEAKLRGSERKFRSVFEQAAIGIARVGFGDARWKDVNEAVCRIVGYSREQLLRTPWPEITHPEDVDLELEQYQQMSRGEIDSYTVEKRFLHGESGQAVWARLTLSLVRDATGRPDYEIAIIEDITARKEAETRLYEVNERLVDADRRKDEFLAVLSHELRNPLAPIRYGVDILDRAPATNEHASRAIRVIERQTRHMTRLIDDLLDVTRISRGKITLHREPLELNALARGTAEDYREVYARSKVHLEVEEASAPVWVHGDRVRLAQAIGNLLHNAAKFTPAGGHAVVSVSRRDGREAVVTVRDDGIGMRSETLAHLFEPFTQAAQSIERTSGGLGLGLALVRGLVEMHGGNVMVTSGGEGRGAEFVITLPLGSEEQRDVPTRVAPNERARARRVLVIEDNVDAAEGLRALLRLDHAEVEVASSGPEGVETARRFLPDVILCDIGLPGLDGYGVARALRADTDERVRSTFLVALSGYALEQDVERSRAAGFDAHLAKPASANALAKMLGAGAA